MSKFQIQILKKASKPKQHWGFWSDELFHALGFVDAGLLIERKHGFDLTDAGKQALFESTTH